MSVAQPLRRRRRAVGRPHSQPAPRPGLLRALERGRPQPPLVRRRLRSVPPVDGDPTSRAAASRRAGRRVGADERRRSSPCFRRIRPARRPPARGGPLPYGMHRPITSSFPSGHATSAFTAATLLAAGPAHAPASVYALAALVAGSRVYVRMHHALRRRRRRALGPRARAGRRHGSSRSARPERRPGRGSVSASASDTRRSPCPVRSPSPSTTGARSPATATRPWSPRSRGGTDLDVRFLPFSLDQVHVEEGEPPVWERDPAEWGTGVTRAAVRHRGARRTSPSSSSTSTSRCSPPATTTARSSGTRTCCATSSTESASTSTRWPTRCGAAGRSRRSPPSTPRRSTAGRVFGVPTFIEGDEAVFIRFMERGRVDDLDRAARRCSSGPGSTSSSARQIAR